MSEPKIDANVTRWRRFFDRQADDLGTGIEANGYFNPRTFRITHGAILSLLKDLEESDILDAGCGNGRMLQPLTGTHRLHGIDVSEKMCALALDAGYRSATVGDCEHLETPDESVDVAISCGIVQLLPTAERAVGELVRVTRPGGQVIVVTINEESLLRKLFKDKPYVRAYRATELIALGRRLGLERIEVVPLFFPLALRARLRWLPFPVRWAMASFIVQGFKA